jgi:hypothetical protein
MASKSKPKAQPKITQDEPKPVPAPQSGAPDSGHAVAQRASRRPKFTDTALMPRPARRLLETPLTPAFQLGAAI